MGLFAWAKNRIEKFNIWDIAIFKIYLASLGMIVGAYFSQFVKTNIWIFTSIAVLSGLWMIYKMFKK